VSVFSLSIHADYRCRHSGACCTADWDVPVEAPVYRSLNEALDAGRLTPASASQAGDPPLLVAADLPDEAAAMVARTPAGDCVFYHRPSGLCVVHRDVGEPMLPATCRHFPRLAVQDPRGTFVSLSHFCPTAAASLFREDVPLEIVEHPQAFPERDYDGLRVSADDWPPLLRPTMLADFEGYDAWERHMVARCGETAPGAEDVIATLYRDARVVRSTRLGDGGSIARAIAALPASGVSAPVPETLDECLVSYSEIMTAVPDDMRPGPDEAGLEAAYVEAVRREWPRWRAPLKRYVAAKAFASWTAYQGRGFLTIVRGLDAALALVRVEAARQCRDARRSLDETLLREAFRQADFSLNHLASGDELAAMWSKAEKSKTATTGA